VLKIFQQYLEDDEFAQIRANREPLDSANLSMLYSSISELISGQQRVARRSADSLLPVRNKASYEAVEELMRRLADLRAGSEDIDVREIWDGIRHAALCHDFLRHDLKGEASLLDKYHMIHPTPFVDCGCVYLDDAGNLLDPAIGMGRRWRLDAVYGVIRDNETIRRYFNERGFEMGFVGAAQIIFTPYAHQAILTGAVGEAAVKALFEAEFGRDTFEPLPDTLYELVDLKLAGCPVCIDAKNYSESTLVKFGYEVLDADTDPNLTGAAFARKAVEKSKKIRAVYGASGRLIYINLAASDDRAGLELYNRDFAGITNFDEAEIIVVPGAIRRNSPNELSHGMQTLFDYLKRSIQ
jgi:hypothetical protein